MSSQIALTGYMYNIGLLTVNIEFMWRGLETGKERALASLSNSIFTVNTPILYLSCIKICKKLLSNLITNKKDNGNPIDISIVVPVKRGVA